MRRVKVYIHRTEDWYSLYLNDNDIEVLSQYADVVNEKDKAQPLSEDELINRIGDAEVIISLNGKGVADFTQRVIDAVKGTVKVVCIAHWWNIHNTFVPMCQKAGITVIEGTNLNTVAVAEWTLGAILAGSREIFAFDKRMKAGSEWGEPRRTPRLVLGSTLGLVGLGRIGRYVAHFAKALGMKVIAFDAMPKDEIEKLGITPVSLNELFETADVISLHLPVNPKTEGIITKELFAKIKDGALFVNSARAALYNQQDLIDELKTNRFTAFLDVFDSEPLDAESPLRSLDNAVISPHIAGDNYQMFKMAGTGTVKTVCEYFKNGTLKDMKYEI